MSLTPTSDRVCVVAAGGTGGHLFPAEALARVLIARGWRVVLATDDRGARYAGDFPAEERLALEAATFRVGDPLAMARGAGRIFAGRRRAAAAFARLKPAVVIGFGGYPSLPALLAAEALRIPRLIHEQNAVLGRVNRFLSRRVQLVACAFPTLEKATRQIVPQVVGNPVRPEIGALYDLPYVPPGALDGPVRLLVTGGSQGARLLSDITPLAVAALPEALRLRMSVEQQTRPESLDAALRTYADAGVAAEVAPFFSDMAGRLAGAHLVIGRAGASTVCELAVAGRPSILVPLGIAADDHQRYNARLLTQADAALLVTEAAFTPQAISQQISTLLARADRLGSMARAARSVAVPDADERLANVLEQVADQTDVLRTNSYVAGFSPWSRLQVNKN